MWSKTEYLHFVKFHKVDLLFIIFILSFSAFLYSYVSMTAIPTSDGADFLNNARSWLYDTPIISVYRSQLISWIIAGVWLFTGENWLIIKYIIPTFTIIAGIILYILLRKPKGTLFAFGVCSLTMINPYLFFWGTYIMTESLSLFFIILSLYFMKSEKESHWYLAGISIGLTFASRYSTLIEVLVIFIVECVIRKNRKFATRTIISAFPVIIGTIIIVYLKVGYFVGAQATDTHFTVFLSPYYLQNSINIWGFSFILLPVAFLFRRTYTDKYNYIFIAWFIVSLLFWSANSDPILRQPRYIVQFTPAVYYLVILAVENISKIKMLRKSFNRLGGIFSDQLK